MPASDSGLRHATLRRDSVPGRGRGRGRRTTMPGPAQASAAARAAGPRT